MSKKLNEAAMESELTGSAFFKKPSAPIPAQEPKEASLELNGDDNNSMIRRPKIEPSLHDELTEDLNTVAPITRSHRFTEDELEWLRQESFKLTGRFGATIPKGLILRVAIRFLRKACKDNPGNSPLIEAISQLRR